MESQESVSKAKEGGDDDVDVDDDVLGSQSLSQSSQGRKLRRACEECTRSKVKCSGTESCSLCFKRKSKCVYHPRRKRQKKSNGGSVSASQSQDRVLGSQTSYTDFSQHSTDLGASQSQSQSQTQEKRRSTKPKASSKEDLVADVSKALVDLNRRISGKNNSKGFCLESIASLASGQSQDLGEVASSFGLFTGIEDTKVNDDTDVQGKLQKLQLEKQMLCLMKDIQICQAQNENSKLKLEIKKLQEDNKALRQAKDKAADAPRENSSEVTSPGTKLLETEYSKLKAELEKVHQELENIRQRSEKGGEKEGSSHLDSDADIRVTLLQSENAKLKSELRILREEVVSLSQTMHRSSERDSLSQSSPKELQPESLSQTEKVA